MASSPKPPNPYQTAAAQQSAELGAGQASAIINNANQYTPWGSRTYTQAGWETIQGADGKQIKVPRYNETTKLSPDQMRLLGLQTQMQYNLGQTGVEQSSKLRTHLGQTVNTAGLQDWAKGPAPGAVRQDTGATNRAAIEAAMMGRFNRDAATTNAAQEAQLAARGLTPGSQGWGTVQEQQDRARTDALQQAYLASGAEAREAQAAFNAAGLQRYQMGGDYAAQLNNLRTAQLQERLAMRNQPINEITALLGGSQVTPPQFQPFSRQGINAAPVGNYIQSNYGQQAQQSAAFNQGLFGLMSAGLYGGLTGGWGMGG
jgi:hypothetical protein